MLRKFFAIFGADWGKFKLTLMGWMWFLKDFLKFRSENNNHSERWQIKILPILFDKADSAGDVTNQYFHQDLYVAQKIYKERPQNHLDIGSRLDGFVAHLATFMTVDVLDIRPIKSQIKNVNFVQCDLMSNHEVKKKYHSISCLHAIEHFGLGRYGDSVNVDGHIKGLKKISEYLACDGVLYFSVPIGPQQVCFNAHRIFSIKYILNWLDKDFEILNFSYIDDFGNLYEDVSLIQEKSSNNFDCNYGCGIFIVRKLKK